MVCAKSSLDVSFSAEEKRLYLECHGKLISGEFRDGLLKALEFAKDKHVKQWLLDFREIGKLDEVEEAWVQLQLYPQMMMNLGGDNYVAIILSEQSYQNLLTEAGASGLQSYNSFIIMNNFCQPEEAVAWLNASSMQYE